MSTLYLVATPIGNLEDITLRALNILRQVRLIAAEDTRHTRKLLAHFDLHTPLVSYFEHNKLLRLDEVLAELSQGDVALVSDAGTPALNDPGYELVQAALSAGHEVSPIPGPSAPIAALTASGLPTDAFLYLGYLPRKPGERRKRLTEIAQQPHTLILLESPHRLLDTLDDLLQVLGDRPCAVARELTKLHEEIFRGSLNAARAHFAAQGSRGEFTLVVGGYVPQIKARWSEAQLRAAIQQERQPGVSPSSLAKRLAAESGWERRQVYRLIEQSVRR